MWRGVRWGGGRGTSIYHSFRLLCIGNYKMIHLFNCCMESLLSWEGGGGGVGVRGILSGTVILSRPTLCSLHVSISLAHG